MLLLKKFVALIRQLYEWTLLWAKHPQATKALSILSFLEASIFPLPVDPLLLAMGFSNPRKSFYYAFLTTLFSVLGAVGGYFIGVYAWSIIAPLFFDLVFSQQAFENVTSQMQSHGTTFVSLFVAGFSPIPFKIFTIAGGVVSAPLIPFIAASILSRGLRYFILSGVIYSMGPRAQQWIESHFEKLTYIVSALLILTALGFKFLI
jgi:membrane protein YqaA with SNARE-associated domain